MIDQMRFCLFLLTVSAALAQDAGATHNDWPHYGGTQFSWRYSALDQINAANVKALTPAWLFQTGDYAENLQATPMVQDGVMYLITARARVFARGRRHRARTLDLPVSRAARAAFPASSEIAAWPSEMGRYSLAPRTTTWSPWIKRPDD